MMKKRTLSIIICLMFAFSLNLVAVNASAADFEITPAIDYDNEKITITGVTPALYGQNVSIVIYAPQAAITAMSDVTDRDNPEPQYPLSVENIKKIKNVTADMEGNFKAEFNLADLSAGYYMVSASGGGYRSNVSKDSEIIYFENVSSINDSTIPAFNAATADTVETLIREKELLIGVDVAGDYNKNSEVINSLFESVKTDDYPQGYSAGDMFKIQKTFESIDLLREMYATADTDGLIDLLETNKDILGIDITDKDYKDNKTVVAQVFLNIIADGEETGIYTPRSMLDARKVFSQSMGIAKINSADNTAMTAIFNEYGEVLGLDMTAYKASCDKYTATEVNKAFVQRKFALPKEVITAYDDCIDVLEEKEDSSDSSDSFVGGGGGGGGGGGSKTDYTSISKDIVEENLPKDEMPQKFNDVEKDHWSYDAVQTLAEMGILEGDGSGNFAPNDLVTREQFVKMLVLAGEYYDSSLAAEFSDVAADRWSSAYIASAVSRGIVTGYEDSSFRPAATLLRQDAAVMAYRLCNVMNVTLNKTDSLIFSDADYVSEYAVEAVATLESSEIINGFEDGSFSPLGTLTRAQAAKIIYGILTK